MTDGRMTYRLRKTHLKFMNFDGTTYPFILRGVKRGVMRGVYGDKKITTLERPYLASSCLFVVPPARCVNQPRGEREQSIAITVHCDAIVGSVFLAFPSRSVFLLLVSLLALSLTVHHRFGVRSRIFIAGKNAHTWESWNIRSGCFRLVRLCCVVPTIFFAWFRFARLCCVMPAIFVLKKI